MNRNSSIQPILEAECLERGGISFYRSILLNYHGVSCPRPLILRKDTDSDLGMDAVQRDGYACKVVTQLPIHCDKPFRILRLDCQLHRLRPKRNLIVTGKPVLCHVLTVNFQRRHIVLRSGLLRTRAGRRVVQIKVGTRIARSQRLHDKPSLTVHAEVIPRLGNALKGNGFRGIFQPLHRAESLRLGTSLVCLNLVIFHTVFGVLRQYDCAVIVDRQV